MHACESSRNRLINFLLCNANGATHLSITLTGYFSCLPMIIMLGVSTSRLTVGSLVPVHSHYHHFPFAGMIIPAFPCEYLQTLLLSRHSRWLSEPSPSFAPSASPLWRVASLEVWQLSSQLYEWFRTVWNVRLWLSSIRRIRRGVAMSRQFKKKWLRG